MLIQGKTRKPKDALKHSGVRRQDCPGQRPPRPGCGDCHHHLSPGCFSFFVALHFLTRFFSILCCYFAVKRGCIWLQKGNLFHSSTILHHLVLVLVSITEKEREAKIARIRCRVCDRKIQVRFWLSISFPSVLFSHFRFIFCNFDLNF